MSKVKRVYHIRKALSRNTQTALDGPKEPDYQPEEPKEQISVREEPSPRVSSLPGPELVIDTLSLEFVAKLNSVELQGIKVTNIGSSAVYVEWRFKNSPKINPNGTKDSKPKFQCHYSNNVIKPQQDCTFIFGFLSEILGHFTEQVDLNCEPPLQTPIPTIKLTGRAFISDEWATPRAQFMASLQFQMLFETVRETLWDVTDRVRLPSAPRPDVKNIAVAQAQFQRRNSHKRLFFNSYLHGWFNELHVAVCRRQGIPPEEIYWDQSVESLEHFIKQSNFEEDEKMCYLDRLEHYCHLSLKSPKSQLYETVYEFVSTAAYKLGGQLMDSVRKELDMWEVPFREPLHTDTPEDLKARKEQIDKIKAEWLKRAKKKKWGEEEERELLGEYRARLQKKTTEEILHRFTGFEEKAQFVQIQVQISKPFSHQKYHQFLERLQTVRETPLQGKKVLVKFDLQLKPNCQARLLQLEEYLSKKHEEERRIEEEKKEEGSKKKKKGKKKGGKEEEELKPFEFLSILDEQNWNGFLETFRVIQEKAPLFTLIGCTYGTKPVRFLLQYLRTIEPTVQFLTHEQLAQLPTRLESIPEGAVYLLQNMNFLAFQTMRETTQEQTRRLLHCEIRSSLNSLEKVVDVVVSQERIGGVVRGINTYIHRPCMMGTLWWRYVGLSMRAVGATIVINGAFTADMYLCLRRLLQYAKEVILTGLLGYQFYCVKHSHPIQISPFEKDAISSLLMSPNLVIPIDFILQHRESKQVVEYKEGYDRTQWQVTDVGVETVNRINQTERGTLFLIGGSSLPSFTSIAQHLYRVQEVKRKRHVAEAATGINYAADLVVYLVGIDGDDVEKIQLRQVNQEDEEEVDEKRKIDLIGDFKLGDRACLLNLLIGKFNYGLKDIALYPKVIQE